MSTRCDFICVNTCAFEMVMLCFQFAAKMEQAQGKFTSMLPTQDVNTARHLLKQHQDIKKSESHGVPSIPLGRLFTEELFPLVDCSQKNYSLWLTALRNIICLTRLLSKELFP